MMVKRNLAAKLVAAVLASSLLLSACDGGSTPSTTEPVTTPAPAQTETQPVETESAATEADETESSETVVETESQESAETEPAETGDSTEPSDSETATEPSETEAPVDESDLLESPETYEPESPVTISYAGWENDLNFSIITDKFTQRHPNINVVRFESNFVDEPELTRLAAAGELPDVISINNIGLSAKNGWLIDIRDRFEADPIAEQVSYDNIIKSLDIMGHLYALPTTIFFGGMVVNTDLLEANNITIPDYEWTISDMEQILRDNTVRGESVGAMDIPWMYNWLPGTFNKEGGRMFFNNETKRFELGENFDVLVSKYKELINANVTVWEHADQIGFPWELEEGDPERKRQEDARAALQIDLYGTTDHGWDVGRAGMQGWESHGMGWLRNIPLYTGFTYDYYPYPKADNADYEGIKPGLVTDLAGITTSADDVEDAAWEFLKYITFETVGYTDRLEGLYAYDREEIIEKYGDNFTENSIAALPEKIEDLYNTQGPHMNMIPPMKTQTAIDAFKEFHPIGTPDATPGLYYQLDYIDQGYLDLHRNQPGFNEAFGVIHGALWNEVVWGDKAAADIAQEVEDNANQVLDNWLNDIQAAIDTQG